MSFPYITVLTFLIITFSPYPSFSFNYGEVSGLGLTEEESAALNQLNSIFNNNIDSQSLQRAGADTTSMQDATMHLMDIRRRWDNRSPGFKAIAGDYFLKKPAFQSGASMSKVLALGSKSVRGMHLLPNWIETANFSI